MKENKTTMTLSIAPELYEKIRDAAYWIPGASQSGIITQAFESWLADYEKKYGRLKSRFEPSDYAKASSDKKE